ncbi:NmrA/HSCARG family protein [Piscinibacter sp.]|uniref:NmrA/HSCARG family protein n=1 Tax=Piscinibacter sp. TaxID=1903157 RepID=UPI002CF62C83|nr:NmrA/HSCARG family protein [Albitalea sp.]HUG23105.1 NmrA/HSCARG family protein [Albitalea sp.]
MNKVSVAVLGATGAQGGGLVRAALSDPARRFAPRALTRKPQSTAAQALARAGADVVAADLDDVDSLAYAFAGVHGVFAVTNFWEHHSPEAEHRQARNVAIAAQRAGVKHVVWSTLEDTRDAMALDDPRMPVLMGRYKVPHMDTKGEANAVFRELGVPTTFLYTSFYWDNLIHFGMAPQRGADGDLVFTLPLGDVRLPGIAASDIGACALALFAQGDRAIGRDVGIAGEHLGGAEMAAALVRALGEPVRYHAIGFASYAQLAFPGAAELANMFQYKHDFNDCYCASRPVAATRALHPGLLSFEGWLDRHRAELPVPSNRTSTQP